MNVPIQQIQIPTLIRIEPISLEDIKQSLQKYGMLHPVVARKLEDNHNPPFELVAGYRRLKAAESLGWAEVPITLYSPTNSINLFDVKVEENMKRKDLNPMEISELIIQRKRLWEHKFGPIKRGPKEPDFESGNNSLTNVKEFYNTTSGLFRKQNSDIYRFLQLQDLDDDLKVKVESGELYYRKAIVQQMSRKAEAKSTFKKKGLSKAPHVPIDIQNLNRNFQNVILMVGGMNGAITSLNDQQMDATPLSDDRIHNLILICQKIRDWVTKLESHLQNIQLQRKEIDLEISQITSNLPESKS